MRFSSFTAKLALRSRGVETFDSADVAHRLLGRGCNSGSHLAQP